MAVLSLPLSFTNSFWSQDYRRGLEVLYSKLEQGVHENDEILAFVRARAVAERQLADSLSNPMLTGPAGKGFGIDDGASLLMAFRGLQAESTAQGQAHKSIATELDTLVADPFELWAQSYKDRLHQSKGSIIDYYLRAYEQAHGEVSKLKHQYLAKTRRADEAEDDAKFAPNSGGRDSYTSSPRIRPLDGRRSPPVRTASVSERIAQRLREIQKKSVNAVAAAAAGSDGVKHEAEVEKELPKVDKGKGKAIEEEPTIIASPPPMSPLLPPSKLEIPGSPMPPMPPPPMLLAGLSLPPVAVSQLLTRAAAELPLRPVRFPLLGEYPDCFTGEEFVAWLNENVHGFGGSLDRAEDAAKELTERDNLLRRIGEFGNQFEHSDEAFYQFRPKAFDLEGKNEASAGAVSSPIKTPDTLIKRTNTFVNLVSKALSTQNAEPAYVKARNEADEADHVFRVATRKLDRQRLGLEERIEENLKLLQRWEMERLRAVKTVLLQYHGTMSNLPKTLEPSNERSGTLIAAYLPESDLNALIERYRTGPFRPEAQVYESVSHVETDVVFGVDLRRWAEGGWDTVSSGEPRKHNLPPVLPALLTALTEAYKRLPNDIEKRKSWIYEVPLPAVHHLREALNAVPIDEPVPPELFAPYDAPVIAGTIKLWLLELDPPLALWEGWDEIRKIYPAVGAAKNEGSDADAQRITDLGTALQRLPRVHLLALDAVVSHVRNLIDTTTVEETEEVYITKLGLSVGRTIIRPKFESELSIQDRHPTLLFIDLVKNYAAILPPTIARKKRDSERKIPLRKRTAPVDMRLSRSRISVGADTQQLLAAQQVAQNPSLHRASRSIDTSAAPSVPPVPPMPPTLPAVKESVPPPPPPPSSTPKPLDVPPPPPLAVPPPPPLAVPSPPPIVSTPPTESKPFVPPPPPPALPTAKVADQSGRPTFKEPPPELDDDLPPRPMFKEPPPESPEPAEETGIPTPVITPPTPQKTPAKTHSRNGSVASSPTKVGSRSTSPAIDDGRPSRSSSGQAAVVRGPRVPSARGPRPPSSGSVSSMVSNLNRKNSAGSPPSSPSYKRLSGSPGRPSSVLGRAPAFSTRTMESDAEDNVVDKK
ncbi:hypothetical protein B0H16DRAFT_1813870 [Mycena metata]|uniref:Rho-GAP domain-containing protein n=1 Tax=Mycena metata TaxID=1033252 RepID=A0AAD7JDI5_9AGAR|nr:hypothetical protein B0H16DRAFT_1813870 [Mycena metata]